MSRREGRAYSRQQIGPLQGNIILSYHTSYVALHYRARTQGTQYPIVVSYFIIPDPSILEVIFKTPRMWHTINSHLPSPERLIPSIQERSFSVHLKLYCVEIIDAI